LYVLGIYAFTPYKAKEEYCLNIRSIQNVNFILAAELERQLPEPKIAEPPAPAIVPFRQYHNISDSFEFISVCVIKNIHY
jgi:hypothetical protein